MDSTSSKTSSSTGNSSAISFFVPSGMITIFRTILFLIILVERTVFPWSGVLTSSNSGSCSMDSVSSTGVSTSCSDPSGKMMIRRMVRLPITIRVREMCEGSIPSSKSGTCSWGCSTAGVSIRSSIASSWPVGDKITLRITVRRVFTGTGRRMVRLMVSPLFPWTSRSTTGTTSIASSSVVSTGSEMVSSWIGDASSGYWTVDLSTWYRVVISFIRLKIFVTKPSLSCSSDNSNSGFSCRDDSSNGMIPASTGTSSSGMISVLCSSVCSVPSGFTLTVMLTTVFDRTDDTDRKVRRILFPWSSDSSITSGDACVGTTDSLWSRTVSSPDLDRTTRVITYRSTGWGFILIVARRFPSSYTTFSEPSGKMITFLISFRSVLMMLWRLVTRRTTLPCSSMNWSVFSGCLSTDVTWLGFPGTIGDDWTGVSWIIVNGSSSCSAGTSCSMTRLLPSSSMIVLRTILVLFVTWVTFFTMRFTMLPSSSRTSSSSVAVSVSSGLCCEDVSGRFIPGSAASSGTSISSICSSPFSSRYLRRIIRRCVRVTFLVTILRTLRPWSSIV